jgi:hypothetical protein
MCPETPRYVPYPRQPVLVPVPVSMPGSDQAVPALIEKVPVSNQTFHPILVVKSTDPHPGQELLGTPELLLNERGGSVVGWIDDDSGRNQATPK